MISSDEMLPVLHFGAPDVRALFSSIDNGSAHAGPLRGRLAIIELAPGGWERNSTSLNQLADDGARGVVVASVSGELRDPSIDPLEALTELAGVCKGTGRHLLVMNVPTIARQADHESWLRVRSLNLAVVEASIATGLCVIDADRIVAEMPVQGKISDDGTYADPVLHAMRTEVGRILEELGLTGRRTVMELRVPVVAGSTGLLVERWLKSEGDAVSHDEVVCEMKLVGRRSMVRPTNAVTLGSLGGRQPILRRLVGGERVKERYRPATVAVVSRDEGVLRETFAEPGRVVQGNERLAILSDQRDRVLDPRADVSVFRTVARVREPSERDST
jgi:hypothetical protein